MTWQAESGCAVLCWAGLCCAVLGCAVLGWAGLGWAVYPQRMKLALTYAGLAEVM